MEKKQSEIVTGETKKVADSGLPDPVKRALGDGGENMEQYLPSGILPLGNYHPDRDGMMFVDLTAQDGKGLTPNPYMTINRP